MNGNFLALNDRKQRGATALLAMSGGVDSAVSALKLVEAGYEVIGLTMKNYCYGDADVPERSCCSLEAIDDARSACHRLGIRHMVASTEEIFGREVYDNFLSEYGRGRTPNPCVRCNSIVRFSTLADYAARLGIDYVATGHYARVFAAESGHLYLARPAYVAKDQSYFLAGLHGEALARVLFPLGDYRKPEVRAAARSAGIDVAEKPESQEVCFIPDGHLRDFLLGKINMTPGNIENEHGEVIGRHPGVATYTVGQRRGLGVAAPHPLYVVAIDTDRNVLVVGEDDALQRRELTCQLDWLDEDGTNGHRVHAQIRSRHGAQPLAHIERDGATARVAFSAPQRAIAAGQTIAFYVDDVVVGSGVIESSGPR